MSEDSLGRYKKLILAIFRSHYRKGRTQFEFPRTEIETFAQREGIKLPKNLGDVVYNIRYRSSLPAEILATAPAGKEWIIEGAGHSRYRFRLEKINRVVPRADLVVTKIPNATPEIIVANAKSDEQALLAIVRYNRLIDVFLRLAAFSLQNHLRTTVKGTGQIEIDEIYVGVDAHGVQYVIPVQAKGGSDQHSVVQTRQDIACCAEKFPGLICRAVSAQFMDESRIAMFELTLQNDSVRVVQEKHYALVPASEITDKDQAIYRTQGKA